MRAGVRAIANTTGRMNYGAMGEAALMAAISRSDFSADARRPCRQFETTESENSTMTTLELEMAGEIQPGESCSPIIDLRQYTLFPGVRNEFIDLFDREFVETQEAVGMRVIGQFRDLGDPNRFVWIRGFPDMAVRARALKDFYVESEAWKKHSSQARSMMIDSSDALLLRRARPNSGFLLPPCDDRPGLHSSPSDGVVAASIYTLAPAADT